MQLPKLAHPVYMAVRKGLVATGVFAPLRTWLGPSAGRLIARFLANPKRPKMVRGHQMYLAGSKGYPPIAMATNRYEEESTKLLEGLLKPGMTVIDAGSHVGYYALLAARQIGPEGRVYAFEPDPDNYELLLRNIALNGYTNIEAVKKALSNQVGTATLFLTTLDNGRHSTYRHGLPERGSVDVETTTIDTFLEARGWPTVDLVKIDIEGAEMDVLEGASQFLAKCPSLKVIIEFSPSLLRNAGADPIEFLNQWAGWEFELNCIVEKKGLVPLELSDQAPLVERLLSNKSSVNLFCSR